MRGSPYRALLALVLLVLPIGSPGADPIPILKSSEVRSGMKGYGLTVFRGSAIERFEVEVIDVLRNAMPKQDMILIRCSHPVLERAKVIAGMSGSPIYLEGKLVGALAYGWGFSVDPIAGVTPIENMLADLARPLEEQASAPARRGDALGGTHLVPVRTPVMMSGFTGMTVEHFRAELESWGLMPMAGGSGSGREGEKLTLVPGAAIGVQLMRGDLDMTGIGTVTWVEGDQVLAFGHPMMQMGELSLPITTAWIHDVLPSQQRSFKFGSPVEVVGRLTQDRQSCVAGKTGEASRMVPVDIRIVNEKTRAVSTFRMEVADHRDFTPVLIRMAVSNSMAATEPPVSEEVVRTSILLRTERHGEVSYGGSAAGFDAALAAALGPAGALLNNRFERVRLQSASVEVSVLHERRIAEIQAAWLEAAEFHRGEEAAVSLELRPFNGPAVRRSLSFRVPANLPDGGYELLLSGGSAVNVPAAAPRSAAEMMRVLKRPFASTQVVAVMPLPSIGLTFEGRTLPNLPISVFGTFLAGDSGEVGVQQDALRTALDTEWIIVGERRVILRVRGE